MFKKNLLPMSDQHRNTTLCLFHRFQSTSGASQFVNNGINKNLLSKVNKNFVVLKLATCCLCWKYKIKSFSFKIGRKWMFVFLKPAPVLSMTSVRHVRFTSHFKWIKHRAQNTNVGVGGWGVWTLPYIMTSQAKRVPPTPSVAPSHRDVKSAHTLCVLSDWFNEEESVCVWNVSQHGHDLLGWEGLEAVGEDRPLLALQTDPAVRADERKLTGSQLGKAGLWGAGFYSFQV